MNERSSINSDFPVLLTLAAAFLSSVVVAQEPTISVVPRNYGPVAISDLHVLLENDLQFQIFDFDADAEFCLVLGYAHEIDGQMQHRSPRNEVVCNVAGPQRLIVVMRPVGEKRRLMFGLHDRNTGAGATRTAANLPIGTDIGGAATFRVDETIGSGQESTLIRWRFGNNPPHPGPRHDVHILVRVDKNEIGIGSYSKTNDFAQ